MPTSRPTSRTTPSGVSRWDFTPLSSLTASTVTTGGAGSPCDVPVLRDRWLAEGPRQGGGDYREGDRDQHRRPKRESDRCNGYPYGLLVDY